MNPCPQLVSGDLVPGVVYDATDADSHVTTNITTGCINTVLEDADQDVLGEITIFWAADSDAAQTTSPTSLSEMYPRSSFWREPLRRSNTVSILIDDSYNDDGVNTSDTIVPQAAGLMIIWVSVCAKTINVHGSSGDCITTMPGDATEWSTAKPGDYFLVNTNTGNWVTWQRSATVSLSTDQ